MSQQLLNEVFSERLQKRREIGLYRTQFINKAQTAYLDFAGNDYLGLSQNAAIKQASIKAIEQYGCGAKASHLVSGHYDIHADLEKDLAAFTGREAALVFSSGYMANLGVIGALVGAGQSFRRRNTHALTAKANARNASWTIFQDKLNHASLLDAAALANVPSVRYRHKDTAHLESLLAGKQSDRKLVITDGIFSMDGDCAPLKKISALCQKYDALLMVDDAHGLGALGSTGGGAVELESCSQDEVPILIGTFGKAFGSAGAFVAGPRILIDGLIQFARTYIYTTAMTPANAAAVRTALSLLRSAEGAQLRDKLADNVAYLRKALVDKLGLTSSNAVLEPLVPEPGAEGNFSLSLAASNSAIQPLVIGDDQLVVQVANRAREKQIYLAGIRAPTVPPRTARIRLTINATQSYEQIDQLVAFLKQNLCHSRNSRS